MCLIFIAHKLHPRFPLVVAANRDEFHKRPTSPAHWWEDAPDLLAGRDLRARGTWLGVNRAGRFAAVTNYREPGERRDDAPSRGELVADFLSGEASAGPFLDGLAGRMQAYNGFSLLLSDATGLWYCSNRSDGVQHLSTGLYGLSNHLLETPWPKVRRGKAILEGLLGRDEMLPEDLLAMLADDTPPEEEHLPDTGIGREWERVLAPMFIRSPRYGTRCSTVVTAGGDGRMSLVERGYDVHGGEICTVHHEFPVLTRAASPLSP